MTFVYTNFEQNFGRNTFFDYICRKNKKYADNGLFSETKTE